MKKKKPTQNFWAVLALVNVVAIACTTYFALQANGDIARLLAVAELTGVIFFLMIIDAISIVFAYEL